MSIVMHLCPFSQFLWTNSASVATAFASAMRPPSEFMMEIFAEQHAARKGTSLASGVVKWIFSIL